MAYKATEQDPITEAALKLLEVAKATVEEHGIVGVTGFGTQARLRPYKFLGLGFGPSYLSTLAVNQLDSEDDLGVLVLEWSRFIEEQGEGEKHVAAVLAADDFSFYIESNEDEKKLIIVVA